MLVPYEQLETQAVFGALLKIIFQEKHDLHILFALFPIRKTATFNNDKG